VVVAPREGSTAPVNGCDCYVDIACDLGIQVAKETSGRYCSYKCSSLWEVSWSG